MTGGSGGAGDGRSATLVTRSELAAIRSHAEADYPAECCGIVLVRPAPAPARLHRRCRNVQDALHTRDPVRFPRDSRTAYHVAPEDLLEIGRRECEGFSVHVIYHSHVDTGAYFSATDRRNALMDGAPTYPGATYVVVAVREGRAEEARAFRWAAEAGDFVETPLDVE